MHRRAEYGIAAHWGYKEQAQGRRRPTTAEMAWLQRIVDWQQDTIDPLEFLETLKLDLEQDEVYVFTPKGKVIALPAGATPIDFAYAIHTEVGPPLHRRQGQRPPRAARHRRCSRPTPSRSSPPRCPRPGPSPRLAAVRGLAPGPQQDPPVVLPRAARGRHRHRPRRARQGAAPRGPARPEAGRRPTPSSGLAAAMNYADLDALHAAIGDGHVSARSVAQRLARELRGGGERSSCPTTVGPGLRPGTPAGLAASASTSRASTTSWCACRGAARRCPATRSWASSPGAAA